MAEKVVRSFSEIVDIAMNIPLHGTKNTKTNYTHSIHSEPSIPPVDSGSKQEIHDARVTACGADTTEEPVA